MISTTSDTCIIAGNLQLIDEGTLSLVKLTDDNNHVYVGDKVVTSSISEKFLPGILIGYISELNNDSNNLTKSGTVNPAVDFKHLQEVLVIRTKKLYVPSDADAANLTSENQTNASDTTTLTAPRAEDAEAAAQAADGQSAQGQAEEGQAEEGQAAQEQGQAEEGGAE